MAKAYIYGVLTEITCNVCHKPCSKEAIKKFEASEHQYACSQFHAHILLQIDMGTFDNETFKTGEETEKAFLEQFELVGGTYYAKEQSAET